MTEAITITAISTLGEQETMNAIINIEIKGDEKLSNLVRDCFFKAIEKNGINVFESHETTAPQTISYSDNSLPVRHRSAAERTHVVEVKGYTKRLLTVVVTK
jgi:hypothetical protein